MSRRAKKENTLSAAFGLTEAILAIGTDGLYAVRDYVSGYAAGFHAAEARQQAEKERKAKAEQAADDAQRTEA